MLRLTLTAWFYDSPMGAVAGEARLKNLQQQRAITVLDAITLTWFSGSHEPRIGHPKRRSRRAAATSSVLEALVRALVLAPAVAEAPGVGIGGLVHRLEGTGVNEEFLTGVLEQITPGTSALLVLSRNENLELIGAAIERGRARGDVKLIYVGLQDDAPTALMELLGGVAATDVPQPRHADTPASAVIATPNGPGLHGPK